MGSEAGAFAPGSAGSGSASVDLFWLPLGAGQRIVQLSGGIYEAFKARNERRHRLDLYHAALEVRVPEGDFAIELTPVPDGNGAARGVVSEGPVGSRWLGALRPFRYELRCWRDGTIPDIEYAVGCPQRLTTDPMLAGSVLSMAPAAPRLVWGRDELRTGEMWNSNSVIAWLLARSGVPLTDAAPPLWGRAPGWNAGLVAARRQEVGGFRQLRRAAESNRPSGS
jgi:hypothetical protein